MRGVRLAARPLRSSHQEALATTGDAPRRPRRAGARGSRRGRRGRSRVLGGFAQDLGDHCGEAVERLACLGLGRLDQQCLVDDQREVHGRRVHTVVEQPFGEVESPDPSSRFIGSPESTNSCMQMRSYAAGRWSRHPPRAGVPAGSWRSGPRPRRPRAARRSRASGYKRRSARTRRNCPGSPAAARSTWGARNRDRSKRCRSSRLRTTCGRGRNGSIRSETAIGPAPGPPPPCGCVKDLCRLKCTMSKPMSPGRQMPMIALRLAPS